MKIELITDCTGIKGDAIHRVFSKRFGRDNLNATLVKGEGFPTPLTFDDFTLTVKKRFQLMRSTYENPDVFVATIQKGYYYSNGLWHLAACVGIANPMFNIMTAMTSSVPVPQEHSEKKTNNLNMNMGDIFQDAYHNWNKKTGSVYTLLTGQAELPWLEQPLRHVLKTVTG